MIYHVLYMNNQENKIREHLPRVLSSKDTTICANTSLTSNGSIILRIWSKDITITWIINTS